MPLNIPTSADIENLKNNVVVISKLPTLTEKEVAGNDVLTYAIDTLSVNSNITVDDFDKLVLNNLLSSDLTITGKWVFGEKSNSHLRIRHQA